MLPVRSDFISGAATRFGPGARRSFFCRVKCRPQTCSTPIKPKTSSEKEEEQQPKIRKKHMKKYCVIQYTGYLKSLSPADIEIGGGSDASTDDGDNNMTCLVAVGRSLNDMVPKHVITPKTRLLEFVSRHWSDGRFLSVDHRITVALGYLTHELVGLNLCEFVYERDIPLVTKIQKAIILKNTPMLTPTYSIIRKDGLFARVQTLFKPFRNPWTKNFECVIAKTTVYVNKLEKAPPSEGDGKPDPPEMDAEMKKRMDSKTEAHTVGAAYAEESRSSRPTPELSPGIPAELLNDVLFNQPMQNSLIDSMLNLENVDSPQARPTVINTTEGRSSTADMSRVPRNSVPNSPFNAHDYENREADMAVIMSLLEADAGLGGPISIAGPSTWQQP